MVKFPEMLKIVTLSSYLDNRMEREGKKDKREGAEGKGKERKKRDGAQG